MKEENGIIQPETTEQNVALASFNNRLANWVSKRDAVVSSALSYSAIPENDNNVFNNVVQVINDTKDLLKDLEKERKNITVVFDDMKKQIMAQEKEYARPLREQLERLEEISSRYVEIQRAKIEAERKAQMEIEARQAQEQAEAEELGIHSVMSPAENICSTEQVKTDGAKIVTVLDFEITNPMEVPRHLCTPDGALIRNFLSMCKKQGMKADQVKIPGVAVREKVRIDKR